MADAEEEKNDDTLTNQAADDDLQIFLEDLEWDDDLSSGPNKWILKKMNKKVDFKWKLYVRLNKPNHRNWL